MGGRAFSGKKFSPTDNSIVIPVQTHAMCFVPKSPVTLCKIGVLPQSICLVFYISSLILCMEAFLGGFVGWLSGLRACTALLEVLGLILSS